MKTGPAAQRKPKPSREAPKVKTFRHGYKTVDLEKLKPWEKNPRTHSPQQIKQLRASIREFGFTNPVLVDEKGLLIAGHGRRTAALAEGLKEAPAIELRGLSATQKRALVIADNRIAENAEWDEDLLKLELGALGKDGFDLSLVGFAQGEIDELLGGGVPDVNADDAPELPVRAISKRGDLWVIGPHRVLCGDSFNAEDVDRLTLGKLVKLILTDPPYAIYGSSTGIAADIADDKMVRPFFEKLGAIIAERVEEFGHVYVHCDWRSYATLWHGLKSAQLAPKNCIVWDKGSAGLGNSYANTHEFVAFFAKLPKQKAMTSGNKRGQRPVHQSNIFRTNRVSGEERQHNAAKPVDLLSWLIDNSSEPGDTVLDLFCGSGSTLAACEKKGRVGMGMEMEPRYVDVIVERLQKITGQDAKLDGDGSTFATIKQKRHVKARVAA